MVGELAQVNLDKAKLWKEEAFRTEKIKLKKEIYELKKFNLEL